ncbi:hypothetical protein Cgig2_016031 [Carnegiea gigantea]|uniref:Growth-regulating factor n=1 Tax=Carnegiea gigantea TaxID=171969 RepID=A0A9Q1KNM2_9CARY|nr:hypothetical protein Cgig2_016031 [Carnegiea gigantea]
MGFLGCRWDGNNSNGIPIYSSTMEGVRKASNDIQIHGGMSSCSSSSPLFIFTLLLLYYDAEAGRCRRTDGKKWRCSRDVAPNHKYCERHLHRGRPRSRKPVELVHHHQRSLCDSSVINNNNDNDDKKNDNATKKSRLDGPSPQFAGSSSSAPLILPLEASTFDHPMGSGPNPFEDSRSSAWNDEQQWQQLVQGNVKSLALHHEFEGVPLNLNSQADFSSKSDMGLLQSPLIDAWSMGLAGSKDNGGKNKSSLGASKGSHGNATDEDKCQIHMGLGLIDSWVASSTSPGGPLAEVLRPSLLTTVSRPELHANGSDSISAQVTKVSSPSRALRKTFVSLSDSSGSNSPTRQSSRTNSDMPFHWLN